MATPPDPWKLTPAVHDKVISLVRAGAFKTTAARACGIDRSTLDRWLRVGKEVEAVLAQELSEDHGLDDETLDPPVGVDIRVKIAGYRRMTRERAWACWRLYRAADRAWAHAEATATLELRKAGREDWRATESYLKRAHADHWEDTLRVGPLQPATDAELLNDEASAALHEALALAAGASPEHARAQRDTATAYAERGRKGLSAAPAEPIVDVEVIEEVVEQQSPAPEPPRGGPRPRTGASALDIARLDGDGDEPAW
jgi:hypothetical protein